MVPYLILGLGAYFVLILSRTKIEDGRVTKPPLTLADAVARFGVALLAVEAALGEALRPAFERAAQAMARFAAAFSK